MQSKKSSMIKYKEIIRRENLMVFLIAFNLSMNWSLRSILIKQSNLYIVSDNKLLDFVLVKWNIWIFFQNSLAWFICISLYYQLVSTAKVLFSKSLRPKSPIRHIVTDSDYLQPIFSMVVFVVLEDVNLIPLFKIMDRVIKRV